VDITATASAKELSDLRITTMFDALSEQRNSALNELVNLKAEHAVIKVALAKQATHIAELEARLQSSS
jgi:hypothetical protein